MRRAGPVEPLRSVLMLLAFVPNQERTFEAFLLGVVRTLRANGWRVIFVFAGEPSDAFSAALKANDADWRVATFPLRSVRSLTEELRPFAPVVMVTTFQSYFNPWLLKLKKDLSIRSWIVHDQTSGVASHKKGIKRTLAKIRGWYYGRHIDRVLAVSEFVAHRSVEQSYLPADRVRTVPNGVDLELYRRRDDTNDRADQPPVIVFAGQLIPEKGIRTLLKAIALLKQRDSVTVTVQVAGAGILESELRRFAADHHLDNVVFVGQVRDVRSLFQKATIAVVPSEWAEAAGIVAIEAMACGACVLASDRGGLPEIVGRDGQSGWLFRAGDVDDLAEKLLKLLKESSTRQQLGTRARARVEQLFGLDQMVSNFVREFSELADAGSTGPEGKSQGSTS